MKKFKTPSKKSKKQLTNKPGCDIIISERNKTANKGGNEMSIGQEINGTINGMITMREILVGTLEKTSSVHFIQRRRLTNMISQYNEQIAELRQIRNAWYRN